MPNVTIKFTGDLYAAVGVFGETVQVDVTGLRELVNWVLAKYRIRDLMLEESGRLRPRARILVNGRYIELLSGWETEVRDGDIVSLMMPGTFVT